MTSRQAERKVDGWGEYISYDDIVEERTIQQNTAIIAHMFYSTRGLWKTPGL